jgi:hypothetical protein
MSTVIYQALELHDRYGYIPMWQCVELTQKRAPTPRTREAQARGGARGLRRSRRRGVRPPQAPRSPLL